MKEWIYAKGYSSKPLFLKINFLNKPVGLQTQQIDSKNRRSAKIVCKLLNFLLIADKQPIG